jgi:nicotinamidase/pyrazinamidase
MSASSLLVVDVQCGFTPLCPDELPIPGALEVVPNINHLLDVPWPRIDASQDWHPVDHCSFFGQRDNLYPPHCIAGTKGAAFVPNLHAERFHAIWRKGFHKDHDAYAITAEHPGFAALLRASGIRSVVVCGLALNICCFFAARDLRREGFEVVLVEDASAGIDIPAANLVQDQTRAEGQALGIRYLTTEQVLAPWVRSHAARDP